ncbi:CHAT domain-containing protein (plasmid) [Tolypothrix sp. PCC 7910]|uniref:AAA-like domain-containing protein n=1 Tax=Tolypothrix sp. PCC 7910 TaxID=2099387 RepID=UPI0014278E74|nr:AAA-like domain-containing protein [Tolypothrix sp. PCC 7910]QIR41899.1 CHAT domain-containing protein [Tolypothrix sp. PCC 7910]
MNYQDFQILVNENQRIRASSSQGEVSGELSLDMDRTKQTLRLIDHQVKDGELLKGLGYELYQALFPNQINARFQATIAGAQANNHSVRLRLIFESPELAALPWEFLYDKQTNTFLGNNTQTVLSRYIDVPLQKRDIKAASLPLKVLLVISSPTNLAKLDVAGEEQLIREALSKHIEAGDIELDVLQEATIRNINQKLREKPHNVFHFIGHGNFKDNKGYIALVDGDGTANLLDDERFANFFLGDNNLGLVILNSCQGATVSANQVFAGTAPNLVRRGIPAVVAMQYSILDATAKLFADEFYRTLALGYPVDAAIQSTRNAISMEVGLDRRDFATPVLYMRASDGIILDVIPKKLLDPQSLSNEPRINHVSMQSLEYPDGSVPLDSPFYLERDGIESLCYQTLLQSASLMRIKAPKLMGKTSLLRRIIAQGVKQNYQRVYLDLGGVNKQVITNLDNFLRWFCSKVSLELDLDNQVDNAWNTKFLGSNDNCTAYLKKYILNQINSPLVLVLDEVDRLFPYSEVVSDFFGMLRSWHEKGKDTEVWKQLRLVLAHSTEVYIPLDYHQSPFNAGVPVELEEFNQQQVKDLATKHGINSQDSLLAELRTMVGGHPYLLRLAMYDVATGKTTFKDLLESATTEAGIYSNHLRYLLEILRSAPDLVQALKQVVNSTMGVELDSMQIYKLHSLGLVQRQNNHVTPRCQLYREYFRRVL